MYSELNISNLFTPKTLYDKSRLESCLDEDLDEQHEVKRIWKKPSEKNNRKNCNIIPANLLFEQNVLLNEQFECL